MDSINQEEIQQEVNKITESLQNIDFTNLDYSNLFQKLIDWSATTGFKLIVGLLVISIGFKLIKKIVSNLVYFLEKKEVDITLIKFLDSLAGVGLKILLMIPIFAYWGIELSGLATLIASAGVAIGLALQGSLSNFAGGFIILLIRPFKVGDFIETTGYSGTVEEIGLFYTNLITIDNKQILIPNGVLSNGSLINYSAKQNRRVDLIFSVSQKNDIKKVKQILQQTIENNPLSLKDPEPYVGVNAHNLMSIDFVIRVWCKTDDYLDLKHELLEEVKIAFDKENIEIPFPLDFHFQK